MTPKILLSLWRERWGKPDTATLAEPFPSGKLNEWGNAFCESVVWRVPGLRLIALAWFVGLVLLLTSLRFSPVNQLVLSLFILLISQLIRRYQGHLISLILLGFAIISTSRYLFWRFDQTLGTLLNTEFFMLLGLLVAELCYAFMFALGMVQKLWPLIEPQAALPKDSAEWPKVGVFVLCTEHSLANIELALNQANALIWPKSKIVLYFVDAIRRDDIHQF